jgi:hypothetical protein
VLKPGVRLYVWKAFAREVSCSALPKARLPSRSRLWPEHIAVLRISERSLMADYAPLRFAVLHRTILRYAGPYLSRPIYSMAAGARLC